MNNRQKEIVDRLEAMPIDQARLEIASGSFGDIGSPNHAFASSWLSAKEASLRDAREAEMASILNKSLSKAETPLDAREKIFSLNDTWKDIKEEYGVSKKHSVGK